jgi:hypothetical protein
VNKLLVPRFSKLWGQKKKIGSPRRFMLKAKESFRVLFEIFLIITFGAINDGETA